MSALRALTRARGFDIISALCRAGRVIAVTDPSPPMKRNLSAIASVEPLDMPIIDAGADAAATDDRRQRGIDVPTARPPCSTPSRKP